MCVRVYYQARDDVTRRDVVIHNYRALGLTVFRRRFTSTPPFGIQSGSVRGAYGVRSESVQISFKVCSKSVRGACRVRLGFLRGPSRFPSGSVRGPIGIRSGLIRGVFEVPTEKSKIYSF